MKYDFALFTTPKIDNSDNFFQKILKVSQNLKIYETLSCKILKIVEKLDGLKIREITVTIVS